MSYLTHKQQVLVKVQSVPGTFEPLAAADGRPRLWATGEVAELQAPKNPRTIARRSLTPMPSIGGTKALGYALRSEINTPDVITQALEYAPFLLASAHTLTQAYRIPLTGAAIASGPVPRNATVTGQTSGATGRVWLEAVNGDTHLYYVPVSGTLQAENLTFTGGATAVSSGAPEAWGWSMRPSDPIVVVSLQQEEDGYIWAARDAMCSIMIEAESAKQSFIDFDVLGVKHLMQAAPMTSGIVYDTENPPVTFDADLQMDSFLPVFTKWSFEQALNLVGRPDGNAAGNTGLRGARGTTRDPKIKVTYEHVPESEFDLYGLYESSQAIAFKARTGTDAGKRFHFFADQAIVDGISQSNADGIRMAEVTLKCTHTQDNMEYEAVWS